MTTFELARRLGIDRLRLKGWMDRGFIKPTEPAPKQGRPAFFDDVAINRVVIFKRLLDRGIKRKEAARLANSVNKITEEVAFIMWTSGDISTIESDGAAEEALELIFDNNMRRISDCLCLNLRNEKI